MTTSTVTFFAHGHKNIIATHKTTFEITKEAELSKQGDCIVAVESTKGAIDLPLEFRKAAKKEGAKITIIVEVEELKEIVNAEGNPHLQLTHPTDLVVRKGNFVCARTLAICANKAAIDFSRDFIEKLKNSNQNVKVILTVKNH
jgi:hypothetical protein